MNGYLVADDPAHHVDLPEHTIDELGAVPAADEELLDPRAEQSSFDLEAGTALVPFGVDHVHASRRDSDVVDIGLAAWDPPVMQHPQALVRELVEAVAEPFLPDRTVVPRLRGLRVFTQSQNETSELRVLGPDAFLALAVTSFELPPR